MTLDTSCQERHCKLNLTKKIHQKRRRFDIRNWLKDVIKKFLHFRHELSDYCELAVLPIKQGIASSYTPPREIHFRSEN